MHGNDFNIWGKQLTNITRENRRTNQTRALFEPLVLFTRFIAFHLNGS